MGEKASPTIKQLNMSNMPKNLLKNRKIHKTKFPPTFTKGDFIFHFFSQKFIFLKIAPKLKGEIEKLVKLCTYK